MTAKHTPGPWLIKGDRLGAIDVDDGKRMVAGVYLREGKGEEDANARLIAAAPDMLQRLRKDAWILETYAELLEATAPGIAKELARYAAGARATIAKATGGPSDA